MAKAATFKPDDYEEITKSYSEVKRQLSLIEEYILPLKLIEDTYPIEEHVRVAAGIVRKTL